MAEPFVENLEDLEAKSRETYHQIDCRTAGGAETIIEAVPEAGGEEANKVILEAGAETIIEAVLEAGGEEANEVILEADAEKADEAIELVDKVILEAGAETIIEAVLEAGGEEANEVILEADAEEPNEVIAEKADEAIELRPHQNTRLCLGRVDEFGRRVQGYIRRHI